MSAISLRLPSPVFQLFAPELDAQQLQLFVKRDDLIHPVIAGNKWRKLKYNLQQARNAQHHTLLTFGGAWSNHIHATAAAGHYFGFNTIGVIRGEATSALNACLQDAQHFGMKLHFVNRETYRHKTEPNFITKLKKQFGGFYLIPEGGNNAAGRQGCAEIWDELEQNYDTVCVDCGTGTTLAGLIAGNNTRSQLLGFAVLKPGDFLRDDIATMLQQDQCTNTRWQLNCDYHFGGYAKCTNELNDFMRNFQQQQAIPLEPVYSGKMFYGIFDLIKRHYFAPGSRILAIHGGGLQGLRGFTAQT